MHFNYDVVMIPLQLIIVFFTIYYFVVSWFGLFGKMRETKQFPEKSTFALIVCAHNEQQVIAITAMPPRRGGKRRKAPLYSLPLVTKSTLCDLRSINSI